jgi:hypothetical protein
MRQIFLMRHTQLARFEEKMSVLVNNEHRLKFVTSPLLDLVEPKMIDSITQAVAEMVCAASHSEHSPLILLHAAGSARTSEICEHRVDEQN